MNAQQHVGYKHKFISTVWPFFYMPDVVVGFVHSDSAV